MSSMSMQRQNNIKTIEQNDQKQQSNTGAGSYLGRGCDRSVAVSKELINIPTIMCKIRFFYQSQR